MIVCVCYENTRYVDELPRQGIIVYIRGGGEEFGIVQNKFIPWISLMKIWIYFRENLFKAEWKWFLWPLLLDSQFSWLKNKLTIDIANNTKTKLIKAPNRNDGFYIHIIHRKYFKERVVQREKVGWPWRNEIFRHLFHLQRGQNHPGRSDALMIEVCVFRTNFHPQKNSKNCEHSNAQNMKRKKNKLFIKLSLFHCVSTCVMIVLFVGRTSSLRNKTW